MIVNNSSGLVLYEKKEQAAKAEAKPVKTQNSSLVSSVQITTNKTGKIPAVSLNNQSQKTFTDQSINYLNKIGTGINIGGTVITAPTEIIKSAPIAKSISRVVIANCAINVAVSTPNKVKEKALLQVVNLAGQAIRLSDGASLIATKFHYPGASKTVTDKVLPTANAVVSGIAVYTNTTKFNNALKTNNKVEMLKSGTQIVLNSVSGVTGYMPGTVGQTVSAVTGFSSMFSDFIIDKSYKMVHKK